MKILSIETSCDETGIAIVEVVGRDVIVRSQKLASQITIHAQYGGVYPSIAKREHVKALTPLLTDALIESGSVAPDSVMSRPSQQVIASMKNILEREQELFVHLSMLSLDIGKPDIDCIAVTYGPGLEPALWVGVNFARALSVLWNVPIVAVNHMEGHLVSALVSVKSDVPLAYHIEVPEYPLLALLVSGGHTELVLSESPGSYKIVGQTRDDAAGECFDKTARMLGFPYPGGPEISKAARRAREQKVLLDERLPRPMMHSDNLDFSFSGLKTAVLTYVKKHDALSEAQKDTLALEIEDAIVETLVHKVSKAVAETGAATVVVSGGVAANTFLRDSVKDEIERNHPGVKLSISQPKLSTDNGLMIALASIPYAQARAYTPVDVLKANGNVRLSNL